MAKKKREAVKLIDGDSRRKKEEECGDQSHP